MRILAVVFNQVGRGTYWRAFHFCRILAQRGHTTTLMVMSPHARLRFRQREEAGVIIVETPDLLWGPLRSGWDLWDVFRRMLWLRRETFDIVHAFEARPVVLFPALYAQRRGAKLVMDWADWFGRGGSVEERTNPLIRAVLRPVETYFEESFRTRADGTTVINEFLRDRAIQLGVPPHTVAVIRNGSDERIEPLETIEARRKLGLPLDAPLVGYVGNIFAADAAFMAKAFNLIRQSLPAARLLLVGRFNRNIEADLADPATVIRTGPVDYEQIYAYLSACDVCWLPLNDSGANRGRWPLKLNDYLAAGKPVVATNVGELGDTIASHGVGVVAPVSAEAFAAATRSLLAASEVREALGRSALCAAKGALGWGKAVAELDAYYGRILTGRE